MLIGILFAVLAALVPAAYLLGRKVSSERTVTRLLERVLDPEMDAVEFLAALRSEGDPA